MKSPFLAFLFFAFSIKLSAAPLPTSVSGLDIKTDQTKTLDLSHNLNAVRVVVFLSAHCPCSSSHEQELKSLVRDFPEVQFMGVHSNQDEKDSLSKPHFVESKLPFPIIQDDQAKIADQFHALKTPHAFVFDKTGELVYSGGVTDSHLVSKATKFFLRDALDSLKKGEMPKVREGRTLGCVISRRG